MLDGVDVLQALTAGRDVRQGGRVERFGDGVHLDAMARPDDEPSSIRRHRPKRIGERLASRARDGACVGDQCDERRGSGRRSIWGRDEHFEPRQRRSTER